MVTGREFSAEGFRRSEAFLVETQRLSSTGSFCWRVATNEVTWSAQLYRIFDLDESEPVTPALIGSRIHPDDLPATHVLLERARIDAGDIEHECRLLMPDRSVKYLRLAARATRAEDGRLEYIGAVQDTTPCQLANEALRQARSDLAQMARLISPGPASIMLEVNHPLSAIIINAGTCLSMLTAEQPDVESIREGMRRTLRDAHRASEVVTMMHGLFTKAAL